MHTLAQTYSQPAPADAAFAPEPIAPLSVPATADAWEEVRGQLLAAWQAVIGHPAFAAFDRSAELISTFDQPDYTGLVYRQPTTPQNRQTALLMRPKSPIAAPCPGMVIPFYDPDRMAGIDIHSGARLADEPTATQFGRHLATLGFTVVCPEVYPYNTVPEPTDKSGMSWWLAAARQLRLDHPAWSGVGRLAWDASRALDLLLDQPGIDASHCGIMGHSLGGKIAFYASAFDPRFSACIASDFGIGFNFTNWDDDWYLGDCIHQPGFDRAHHELLALIAPRPFFLVGGEADRPASWHYISQAQRVYDLYGRAEDAGFYHHAAGHTPTAKAMRISYAWLAEQFGLDFDTAAIEL
ncbi:MAG: acetylxylan esterase [Candidatus Latescibacteria bacterium]|nr:acetylxylan esterase [Candidatus Latescibacterota bacterium]